jgi:hypothetical protein
MIDNKKIKIISKDGRTFELTYSICKLSSVLLSAFNNNSDLIPEVELDNISSSILERVVAYMVYHNEIKDTEAWDNQFIDKFTGDELVDLIWSANYLKMNDLLLLGSKKLTDTINNNDPKEIRNILNIKSDFTKDEEEIIASKFEW